LSLSAEVKVGQWDRIIRRSPGATSAASRSKRQEDDRRRSRARAAPKPIRAEGERREDQFANFFLERVEVD